MTIANYIISYTSIAQPMVLVDPSTGNSYAAGGGTGTGSTQVQGPGAAGAATVGNPVLVAGSDGTNTRTIATDASGNEIVVGNVAAAAADSGNPVKIGGVFNSAPGALTNGQRGNIQLNSRGSIIVQLSDNFNQYVAATVLNGDANSAGAIGVTSGAFGFSFNGTSWDRVRFPNIFKRFGSSAASGNPDFLKASAGNVMQFWGLCGATAAFLQIYNKASAPTIGTDTPVLTFPLIANAAFSQSIPGGGAYFTTGVAYAFTTDAAGTTGSAAAAISAFSMLGG